MASRSRIARTTKLGVVTSLTGLALPAQHFTAEKLLRMKPNASCCDCGLEVDEVAHDHPQQVWTIWNGTMIYCPKCAANEGVGYEG